MGAGCAGVGFAATPPDPRLRRGRVTTVGFAPHAASATQLPWKPNGTRCGRCTVATGRAVKSWASRICEVAAIRRVVVDETHQPAVVLTRPAGRGDEHELAGHAPGPEVVDFRGAGVEVVLEVRGGVERVGRVGPHRSTRSGASTRAASRSRAGTPDRARRRSSSRTLPAARSIVQRCSAGGPPSVRTVDELALVANIVGCRGTSTTTVPSSAS